MSLGTTGSPSAPSRHWAMRALHGQLIPGSKAGRQLSVVALVDAIGSGMYLTGSALYFVTVVGLSPAQVGAGLSIGGVVGLLGGVPVGILADRIPAGRVLIGMQVLRGICYTVFCFVTNFPLFALTAAFIGLTDATIPPVHQAVVSASVPAADRVDTLAKIRAVRNIGFSLGAVVATVSIGTGSRAAFLILIGGNALSYFVVAVLLRRIGIHQVTAGPGGVARRKLRLVADPRYLAAAALNGVLVVHMTLLAIAFPLWYTEHTTLPAVFIGVLITVNTVLAVLLQARFARTSQTLPGAVRAALWAGLALAGFGVASQLAHLTERVWAVLALASLAILLLTFAELWQAGSSWTISYDLADPHRRTEYLSTFQLGNSMQSIVGPWLITSLLFPTPNGWLYFGAVTTAAGALTAVVLRPLLAQSSSPETAAEAPPPDPA
jgi:hypothetical protein